MAVANKEWPREIERQLLADACTPNRHPHALWNFVRYAMGWHYRCLEPAYPYWITVGVHRPIIDWLQNLLYQWNADRAAGIQKMYKVMLWMFRGSGKSNLFTTCIQLFQMLIEPDLTTFIGSKTDKRAKSFLGQIKPVLDGSDHHALFTWLYGNWYDPDRTWNQEEIVTAGRTSLGTHEPSIGTFSIDTGITSQHPQQVTNDDPIDHESSPKEIENAVASYHATQPALRNDSFYLYVGTLYDESDVISTTLLTEGVATWTGHEPPEKFKQAGDWHVYFLQARDLSDTSEYPKGRPVLPEGGFTDENLIKRETQNPSHYATQYMGYALAGDHMEITREQIEKLIIPRKDCPPIEYATVHLDTAFKEDTRRAKGDRNAIVTWLHDIRPIGRVYLDNISCSARWRSEEFDTELVRVLADLYARGYRVRAITDEKEIGGKRGVYLRHLQNIIGSAGLRLPEIIQFNRAGTRKVVRIREAASYWLQGYARILDDCPNLELITKEMTSIGGTRFDDISDAAADVWRPEVWRGQHQLHGDEMPNPIVQPGDDILKGRIERELLDMEREIRTPPHRAALSDDYQPYETMKRDTQWK